MNRFERVAGGCLQGLALGSIIPIFSCADVSGGSGAFSAERADLGVTGQALGRPQGKLPFERETFGGNGRTCSTCHGTETGTARCPPPTRDPRPP